jgi:hypothetical protein
MMQAPKDPTRFIKMICVESIELTDRVWGNCSLIEGETYDVLIDAKQNHAVDFTKNVDGWHLVKFGTGLCPHKSKYLKTEAEIRDEKLNDILK